MMTTILISILIWIVVFAIQKYYQKAELSLWNSIALMSVIIIVVTQWRESSLGILGKLSGSLSAEVASSRALNALKEYEPAQWKELVNSLQKLDSPDNTPELAASIVRSALYSIIREKIQTTSNHAVIRYMTAQANEMEYYGLQGEELCNYLLFPMPGLVFYKAAKPPTFLIEELDLARAQVIRDAVLAPQEKISRADLEKSFPDIMQKLRANPPQAINHPNLKRKANDCVNYANAQRHNLEIAEEETVFLYRAFNATK